MRESKVRKLSVDASRKFACSRGFGLQLNANAYQLSVKKFKLVSKNKLSMTAVSPSTF
jgi:hypothetical protein